MVLHIAHIRRGWQLFYSNLIDYRGVIFIDKTIFQ